MYDLFDQLTNELICDRQATTPQIGEIRNFEFSKFRNVQYILILSSF